jgi:hypothetical protein
VASGVPLDSPDLAPELMTLVLHDPFARLARHLTADAEYLALREQYPETMTPDQEAMYRAAVLEYQTQACVALTGPRAAFVTDLTGGKLDETRVAELATAVRTRTEGYLAKVGVTPDAAAMDTYFTKLGQELSKAIDPLRSVTYACSTP